MVALCNRADRYIFILFLSFFFFFFFFFFFLQIFNISCKPLTVADRTISSAYRTHPMKILFIEQPGPLSLSLTITILISTVNNLGDKILPCLIPGITLKTRYSIYLCYSNTEFTIPVFYHQNKPTWHSSINKTLVMVA